MHTQYEQELQALLQNLMVYKNRKKPSLNIEELPNTNIDDCLAYINVQIKKQSEILDLFIERAESVGRALLQNAKETATRIQQYQITMEQNTTTIEHQTHKIEQLTNKLSTTSSLYEQNESLKNMFHSLQLLHEQQQQRSQQKISQLTTNSIKYINDLQKSHHEVTIHKKTMQILQNEHTSVSQKLQELNSTNLKLEQENKKIIEKYVIEIKKREELEKEVKNLGQELKNVKELTCKIEEELQQAREERLDLGGFGVRFKDLGLFSPPEDQLIYEGSDASPRKSKLSEDVQNQLIEHKFQLQMAIVQGDPAQSHQSLLIPRCPSPEQALPLQKSISSSTQKSPFKKKPLVLDPYYCHFMLLSQTIKILSNQQLYFNIDVKPFYKEILNQKIPMFEWREWLINKLQDIVAQMESIDHL